MKDDPPAVRVQGVDHRYGAVVALDGIDGEFPAVGCPA
jgi:hypothetical protein